MTLDYLLPFTAGNAALGVFAFVYVNSTDFYTFLGFNQGPYKNYSWAGLGYTAFWMFIIFLDYACAEEIIKEEDPDDWCSWKRLSVWFKPTGNYEMPALDASTYCDPLKDMSWEDLQFYHNLKEAARISGWTASKWNNKINGDRSYFYYLNPKRE